MRKNSDGGRKRKICFKACFTEQFEVLHAVYTTKRMYMNENWKITRFLYWGLKKTFFKKYPSLLMMFKVAKKKEIRERLHIAVFQSRPGDSINYIQIYNFFYLNRLKSFIFRNVKCIWTMRSKTWSHLNDSVMKVEENESGV